jgi:hypothetical protein
MLVTEKMWTYLYVCVSDVLVCRMSGCELSLIVCGCCVSSYKCNMHGAKVKIVSL